MLDKLMSDEFMLSIPPYSTPESLRIFLRSNEEVKEIGNNLHSGFITWRGINNFVGRLLQGFSKGERFKWELPLSAIVVIAEQEKSEEAERFLADLSSLDVQELLFPALIARVCLKKYRSSSIVDSFADPPPRIAPDDNQWVDLNASPESVVPQFSSSEEDLIVEEPQAA